MDAGRRWNDMAMHCDNIPLILYIPEKSHADRCTLIVGFSLRDQLARRKALESATRTIDATSVNKAEVALHPKRI